MNLPIVTLYRFIGRCLVNVPHISIVNLLAGRELLPEFLTTRDESPAVAARVLEWLNDPAAAAAVRGELAELRRRVGQPGACRRAAQVIAELAGMRAAA